MQSTVEGAKRKVLRRSKKEGHTAVPLPTEAKVRAKQKEIMKEVGVPEGSDRVIVLQNAPSESSERHNIRVVAGSAPTPDDHSQIGVVHNCAAWLALVIRVMVKAGECGLNLHDTSNGGHLGDFDGTRICMWGDGTPIASRPASCMGWTVLDPSCKLFSRGRSRPITYALWRGGEELMIRLLEQLRGELDSDGYVKVEFPEFGTYLRVKLPLRLLSADHKAWCELRGTVGSGGDRRLHWLHPSTPIHLADDVCTYRFCTNLEKMEWWMRQLHFTTKELVSKMGDANRMKVGELQAWLRTHRIDFGAKDLKPALVQRVEASPQWKGGTAQQLKADLERPISERELPHTQLLSIAAAWRLKIGCVSCSYLVPNNPWAHRHLERLAEELRSDVEADAGGKPLPVEVTSESREYLALLLAVDHAMGSQVKKREPQDESGEAEQFLEESTKSLLSRSDRDTLGRWLRDGVGAEEVGTDLDAVENGVAPDHEAKYINHRFAFGVILNNKDSGAREKLGLTAEKIAVIRQCMLMQMGVGCFKNFVYGWHWCRLFFSCAETFAGCAPSIVCLALLLALSNRHIKRSRRPAGQIDVQPEMQCSVKITSSGDVDVNPQRVYADDPCEMAAQHAVQFGIPTLFNILAPKESTLSTYFSAHRSLPFLAAEGKLSVPSESGEFLFEGLHKQPKWFALCHGNWWGMRTIVRATVDRVLRYIAEFTDSGPPQEAKLDGSAATCPQCRPSKPAHGLDLNPARNSVVICPCCTGYSFPNTQRDKKGAFGDIAADVMRTTVEDEDGTTGVLAAEDAAPAEDGDGAQSTPSSIEYEEDIRFADLEVDQHVEVEWEGVWCPAWVKSVSETVVRLFYPGPPEENEDMSKADFEDKQECKTRKISGGSAPKPPWKDEVAVERFQVTVKPGSSYHGAHVAAIEYSPGRVPPTKAGQVKSNLDLAVDSTRKSERIGKQFERRVGGCRVFGQAAISQRLLEGVRSVLGEERSWADLRERGHVWSSSLDAGVYLLIVDGAGLQVKVGAGGRAAAETMRPDQEYVGHCVQVDAESWTKFCAEGIDTACVVDTVTNGCRPLCVCVCDMQKHTSCPQSGVNEDSIPVQLRGMDAPPSSATRGQLDLDSLPLFKSVVRDCIAHQYSLWASNTQPGEHYSITGNTVYDMLTEHCGVEWVQLYGGVVRQRTVDAFDKMILSWLREQDGKPSSKAKKPSLEKKVKTRWTSSTNAQKSRQTFFRGQRVWAKWTHGNGNLDTAVNHTAPDKRGFPGRIAAAHPTQAGFWRVGFLGEPDHPGIPDKHITVREEEADE